MSKENDQLNQSILTPFALGTPMAADPVSDYGSVSETTRLTTGDVNNDGYPDIAAAHGLRAAGLYLNHGDQSFAAEDVFSETWWDVAENTGATSITLGDLDLDGNLDMVIPIYGNHYQEHMVQLYHGNGDGTFELWPVDGYNANRDLEGVNQDGVNDGIIVASGAANPMFPLIADFNGDDLPDVAVSANNGSHSVDVLTQSAGQQFSVSDSDQAGQNPQFMAQGDFNEDGYPDVVAGALYNGVLVFLNNADGTGTLHQEGGTYLSPNHQYVVAADFNGDGHEDIAARGNQDAQVSILYGDGAGHFPTTANFSASGIDGYLVAADIDNDGDSDLVAASTSTQSVDLLLNNSKGHFDAPVSTVLDAAPWGIAAADFDQDGWVDVAVTRSDNTIQVLWNRGGVAVTPDTFNLAENSLIGAVVGTVTASGKAPLTLAITAGNLDPDGDKQSAFAIDAATGVITVNDSDDLDYEVIPAFDLRVTATDADGLSGTADVTVNLNNIDEPGNETPAVEDADFSVDENTANGSAVGAVIATDIDAGDFLAYAITAGNTDLNNNGLTAFAIDPATGEITVNDSEDLDFETNPVFTLTVTVTDTGGLSDTAAITIQLSNVNEIIGTPNTDVLQGTPADDFVNGLEGNDKLHGNAGNDTLIGGGGVDTVVERGDTDFTLTDTQLTGMGADSLSQIDRVRLTGGTGANTLDASGFTLGPVSLDGSGGNDVIKAPDTAGSQGSGSFNRLSGGDGDDNLIGGKGTDRVQEHGDVDFTLTDSQLSGLGTDTLTGIEQAYLSGGSGNNRLDVSQFTGNFTVLSGGEGDNSLIGGSGVDLVRERGDSDFTLTDSLLSGVGTDSLSGIEQAFLIGGVFDNRLDASLFTGKLVVLEGGGGDDTLIGRAEGTDRVRVAGNSDFALTDTQLTGLGTDTLIDIDEAYLIGGALGNRLDASLFTGKLVVLEGGGGDDTLIGSAGVSRVRAVGDADFTLADTLLTGLGTDSLAGIGQAYLAGAASNNTLDASAFSRGAVFLYGNSGDDVLNGGSQNDLLSGGAGDDALDGGAGNDRVLAVGDTDLTVTDTQLTGVGTDSLTSIEKATLSGGPGNNRLDASAFTRGSVFLQGASGDDSLLGGMGNDQLAGGFGVDTLGGGMGGDRITGGDGADRFVFAALTDSLLAHHDRVTDLMIGSDSIDGPSAVTAAQIARLGELAGLTPASLEAMLTPDVFEANGAATFTFHERSFLALNDDIAGYLNSTDAIVEISGISGQLSDLAIA